MTVRMSERNVGKEENARWKMRGVSIQPNRNRQRSLTLLWSMSSEEEVEGDWTLESVMITSQMKRLTMVTTRAVITTIEALMAQITTVSEGIMKKMRVSSTGTIITVADKVSLAGTSLLFKLFNKTKKLPNNLQQIK
jgi:hypothetical protein